MGPQALAALGGWQRAQRALSPSAEGKNENENYHGTGFGLRWAALVWILYSRTRSRVGVVWHGGGGEVEGLRWNGREDVSISFSTDSFP